MYEMINKARMPSMREGGWPCEAEVYKMPDS